MYYSEIKTKIKVECLVGCNMISAMEKYKACNGNGECIYVQKGQSKKG